MVLTADVCHDKQVLASLSVLPIHPNRSGSVARQGAVEGIHQREPAGTGRVLDHDGGRARQMPAEVARQHPGMQVVATARAQAHADGDGAAAIEIGNRLRRGRHCEHHAGERCHEN
jgi:hypothetical protein